MLWQGSMTIIIPKETPHMFIWFSNGLNIPPGMSPLPQNTRLDYVARLKEECAKLFVTKTPVYLIYMGRLLNNDQITLLERLQTDIPNLAIIDYDTVERIIDDQRVINKVSELTIAYQAQERLTVGSGGIADLVDFARLVLLYNSDILRQIAQEKITSPLEWRQGLIYRDFDVTLEKNLMPDIPTTNGYMATLNLSAESLQQHTDLIESAKGDPILIQKINTFFYTHIYNLKNYLQILTLFLDNASNQTTEQARQELIRQYTDICSAHIFKSSLTFKKSFISSIRIENSFLAISSDKAILIKKMIQEVIEQGKSPYAVVQLNFCLTVGSNPLARHVNALKEYLTPQLLGFYIGNDLTWKMTVKNQHTSEDFTPIAPITQSEDLPCSTTSIINTPSQPLTAENDERNHDLQDQITINKLLILSENYLNHLNKASKKGIFQQKLTLMQELHAILADESQICSTRLVNFSTRLQEADKQILKKHREPHWMAFKTAALCLLGITVVGMFVGAIDYALRKNHSIFFAAKSHGERFILDVEESILNSKK